MTISDETPVKNDAESTLPEDHYDYNRMETAWAGDAPDQPQINTSIIAPETNRTLYRAAGFWIRLLAFGIDLGVIACLNGIIWGNILPAGVKQLFIYDIIQTNDLFLGLTGLAYFILMTHYFQQTLGKMITGIQVIQRSGEPLSWTTVIFRELVGRSLSQMMGLNLGYLFCWFNSEKRCLHDLLSDTWVVHVNPESHPGYIAVDGRIA